jgi:hypothetical protein
MEVSLTVYTLVLYSHLLGTLALFIGYGIEWTASSLFRNAASTEQVRAWLRVFKVSPPLSGAGLGILLASGGYLAHLSGSMKQGWIPATLLAIDIALLLGFVLIQPRMRKIRISMPSLNEPVTADLRGGLSDPVLLTAIRVRVLLAAGIVYLMAAKLPFTTSLVTLAIALITGLLFSVAIWRRPNP